MEIGQQKLCTASSTHGGRRERRTGGNRVDSTQYGAGGSGIYFRVESWELRVEWGIKTRWAVRSSPQGASIRFDSTRFWFASQSPSHHLFCSPWAERNWPHLVNLPVYLCIQPIQTKPSVPSLNRHRNCGLLLPYTLITLHMNSKFNIQHKSKVLSYPNHEIKISGSFGVQ